MKLSFISLLTERQRAASAMASASAKRASGRRSRDAECVPTVDAGRRPSLSVVRGLTSPTVVQG